jgi:hypothetical protein
MFVRVSMGFAGVSLLLASGLFASACNKPSEDSSADAGAAASAVTTTVASSQPPTPKAATKRIKPPPPKPPQHLHPGPEALARKARSEKLLKSEGATLNPSLPVIDSEAEAKVRAKDAVVDRAIGLMIVSLAAEGLEKDALAKDRTLFGADAFLTADEKFFLGDPQPSQADKALFGSDDESLGVMLWALGYDAELSRPSKIAAAGPIVKLVTDKGPTKLRDEAKLRTTRELLDAADLIYRYDWACVSARYAKTPQPPGVDCEVVTARHRALNWLIGYQNEDWDDVSTDT